MITFASLLSVVPVIYVFCDYIHPLCIDTEQVTCSCYSLDAIAWML